MKPTKTAKTVKHAKIPNKTKKSTKPVVSVLDETPIGVVSIRPGMLISLSARLSGGVQYHRRDISTETEGRKELSSWETERVIEDKAEYEKAMKVRAECRFLIANRCIKTPFGLICPTDKLPVLREYIDKSRALADDFNRKARTCSIQINLIPGRIEESDTEAMRAIGSELKSLVGEMRESVNRGDVKAIRDAAQRARQLNQMLDTKQQGRVNTAVQTARSAATEILRRVEKDGEQQQKVIASLKLDALDESQFAFLDVDAAAPAKKQTQVDEQPELD